MNIAIVLAGGTGSRIGASIPKQFIEVQGKPMMVYCLEIFQNHQLIDGIVLVCIDKYISQAKEYISKYDLTKVRQVIPGGENFSRSCMNGVDALQHICGPDDNVLIVAADRPFIAEKEISDAIHSSDLHGSGIPVRKCSLCMFLVDKNDRTHSSNYQRENLVQIQSPWTFKYTVFKDSLDKYRRGELPPCEDYPVAMYSAAGNEVYFVEGDPQNIKITEKSDIYLMEAMLKERETR